MLLRREAAGKVGTSSGEDLVEPIFTSDAV